MFDPAKPACTRDGRAARVLGTDASRVVGGYAYPIVAEVEHPNKRGEWVRWSYMRDGGWKSNEPNNRNDLVNRTIH